MDKYMDHLDKLKYFSDEHRKMVIAQTDLQNKAEALDKEWSEYVAGLGLQGQVHFSDVAKKLLEDSFSSRLVDPYAGTEYRD